MNFKDLYVPRITREVRQPEEELLSRISEVNIVKWKEFSQSHGEETNLTRVIANNVKKKTQRHFTIQILAPIGQGKTTFLHYFFKYTLPELTDAIYSETSIRYRFEPIIFDFRSEDVDLSGKELSYVIYRHLNNEIEKRFDCFARDPKNHAEYFRTTHQVDLQLFTRILIENGIGNHPHPVGSTKYEEQCKIMVQEKEKD